MREEQCDTPRNRMTNIHCWEQKGNENDRKRVGEKQRKRWKQTASIIEYLSIGRERKRKKEKEERRRTNP